jgi:ribonuclease HI
MTETLTVRFDGGSRGNPGPAGIGVVVEAADGTPLVTLGRFIGNATNNVAEYHALITGLSEALKLGATSIIVRGDSELVVKHIRGQYRVRHPDLQVLHRKASDLLAKFKSSRVEHDMRNDNALADRLYNAAMDRRADVTDLDDTPSPHAAPAPRPGPATGDHLVCDNCGMQLDVTRGPGRKVTDYPKCGCGGRLNPAD